MKNILSILAVFLLFSMLANAGVKLEFDNYESGNKEDVETSIAIFTPDNLKIESRSGDSFVSILFDAKKDKMIIVNHSEKNYIVFTKEMIKNLAIQVSSMLETMKQQFANLPEAQRKQMEKMMEGQLGGMNVVYTVEKTGETQKINNWNTTKYNLKANDDLKTQIWAAPISSLGVSMADMAVMEKFSNFSAELMKAVPSAQKDPFSAIYQELKGLPVMTINNTSNMVNELKSVKEYSYLESDFQIPSNYSEQKMPMPGGRQ